ncbi:myotubularin-related protein 9-like [Ctenocephalides felis]|uniref:myotubularin-related protein 9-like n=1 Tax=Ctenocephalides felis TaxID=7515 RepID=UPI000E6E3BA4|nr:myotubularin-related protein 9-like [Ctenocephalides felis]
MEFAEFISIPKLDGVILHSPFCTKFNGTLCITGHHIILSSRQEGAEELWILHKCIDHVDKKLNMVNNVHRGGTIIIKCKDFRIIQLEIATTPEFNAIYTTIDKIHFLDDIPQSYPFFYRPMYNILEDGYTLFRPETEYAKVLSSDDWRLSFVNKDFSICPTYGSIVVVPRRVSDEVLIASALFRDGGRFPVFSYKHENGAVLLRSSQPLVGSNLRRCRQDELILNSILFFDKRGYIIDTRSTNLLSHCKSKGGGSEPDQHYTQWKKLHRPLDKVSHGLLESLTKLVEACNDTGCSSDKWISRLESSGWLGHVLSTLSVSCLVAQCLELEGCPVLVHGTKGMDSTLLVTSLTQIILNPDCRTVRGLQALIEREWVQAGYPFTTRHRFSCYSNSQDGRNKQNNATFLLFLDCVHQIHKQFSLSFEFTIDYLIELFEQSYFSQYGTFLGDCEKERQFFKLFTRTTSLWSYLNRPDIIVKYLNPVYEPNSHIIWPSVAPVSIVLWRELFLRWVVDQKHQKFAGEIIKNIVAEDKEIRSLTVKLRKSALDLYKGLQSTKTSTTSGND